MAPVNWLTHHKLTTLLLIAVAYLLLRANPPELFGRFRESQLSLGAPSAGRMILPKASDAVFESQSFIPPIRPEYPPTPDADRLVIRETTLSLVVKEVAAAVEGIQAITDKLGGYLVESRVATPLESASGSITVRIPQEKLAEALAAFRGTGLRVVDENVSGQDVTDQYVDLEGRLDTLEKTRKKFDDLLDRATEVQDILSIQRELVNLQSQIDSLKGQQQYLSQSAKLSKVTVYLSTDEFSLPYSPAQPWQPNVIFKMAVRSLVGTLRGAGTTAIWIGVYSPIWLGILLGFLLLKKKFVNKNNK